MDTSPLEDIGLTNAEIKIYIALLELGQSKAGAVLRKTKLQNSVVHMTLAKLVDKGLATFVRYGKVKHYSATEPRNIIRFIEEKKSRFERLLPELIARQAAQERQEAEVFHGLRGLKAMLWKSIEDAERGDEYLFFSFFTHVNEYDEQAFEFYREFTTDRLRRGIIIKGISPLSQKDRFSRWGYDMNTIVFADFPTLQNISVFRNKVILTPWEDDQVAFLITSHQLAETYRTYFYSVWDFLKTEKKHAKS